MFLIINIFLSYQLFEINRDQYKYIDQQELQNVIQFLNDKNVQVLAQVPDKVYIPPQISVRYHEFDPEKIASTFFSSGNYNYSDTAGGFSISDDNIQIKVNDGLYFTYFNNAISIKQENIDEDKCLDNVYDFINKMNLNEKGRYTKLKDVRKGYVRLVLGQQYNDMPVENSQIEVIANEEGVVEAKINWFEWIKPDKRYNIITPVMALLKIYEDRGQNDKAEVVKQISQGYYFNIDTLKDIESASVLEGTASPMWVIVSDKAEIYINAYNEKIEKKNTK